MFEDRSKSNYDFSKIDKQARTIVSIEKKEKSQNQYISSAYKKLFGEVEKTTLQEEKQILKSEIIKHGNYSKNVEDLPSSSYLKSFENMVAGELDIKENFQHHYQNLKIA